MNYRVEKKMSGGGFGWNCYDCGGEFFGEFDGKYIQQSGKTLCNDCLRPRCVVCKKIIDHQDDRDTVDEATFCVPCADRVANKVLERFHLAVAAAPLPESPTIIDLKRGRAPNKHIDTTITPGLDGAAVVNGKQALSIHLSTAIMHRDDLVIDPAC